MRIAQVGYAMNDAWLPSEQRRGQDRQGGIFRTAHLDRTRERTATVNEDLIHTWQRGIVVYLNNRFSNKCRGNFFPPMSKKAFRSGLARLLTPAFRPGAGALAPAQSIPATTRRRTRRKRARPPGRARLRGIEYFDLALRCREGSRQ